MRRLLDTLNGTLDGRFLAQCLLDPVLAEFLPQGCPVDSQNLGRGCAVAGAFDERGSQERGLGAFEELFIHRAVVLGAFVKGVPGPGGEIGFEAGLA